MLGIRVSLASRVAGRPLTQARQRSLLHCTAPTIDKSFTAQTYGTSTPKHTPDTYSKDVDTSSAPDTRVYHVDSSNEDVQKPYEAPSGEWSRAGVQSEEYRHMEGGKDAKGAKEPYAPAGGDKSAYGSRQTWKREKGSETSKPGEGPEGGSAAGRK